ncbi:TRM11 family SAM-dependent methyltransferase [Paenibacillus hamazuiensis]|uniref:TRM11 family SAM-dependent methyltransferase n=1 Tax=Paenibacillus hamazuiensis TaxID=2936508 RepID=UPI00200EC091|nr:RsmD family RNA methyltransferase [Paenibacillus hamazuiensis]
MSPLKRYLYTFACHEDERELCELELRTLLGAAPSARGMYAESGREIDPSRSPFVKMRLEVRCEAVSVAELAVQAEQLELAEGATFKVVYAGGDRDGEPDYAARRAIEREIGARIRGRADMRRPARLLAVARAGGRWLLGDGTPSEAVWLRHNAKPRSYSTALSTRVARAVVNIAVPEPDGVKAVDPCCGIGTVLIEAASMGIDIAGFDINPLAVRGARANLAHFGMPDLVRLADMRQLSGRYDAAIVDMPYNLCSRLPAAEQLEMLRSVRRLAPRAVIVTAEPVDGPLHEAGLAVLERCTVRKGAFSRQVIVCGEG